MGQAGKTLQREPAHPRPVQSLSVLWVTFILGRGAATAFSPVALGSREEARRGEGVIRGHGANPGTAGLGAGEAGADSARPVQLRPEAADIAHSAGFRCHL